MRILLIAVGSHGDVHPFIGLGLTLQTRGHHVTLAVSAAFSDLVRRAGLVAVEHSSADEFHRLANHPDLWHPLRGTKLVFQQGALAIANRLYDLTVDFLRAAPGVVVTHALGLGARAVADRYDISLATVQLAPAVFFSSHAPPKLPGLFMPAWLPRPAKKLLWRTLNRLVGRPMIERPLNDWRRSIALPPVQNVLGDWWHSPQLVLALFPDWFAAPQSDWPPQVRLTGFPLYDEAGLTPMPDPLERFLAAGPPPVAFTPGSAMRSGADFFAHSADACQIAGLRGVLLTRHAHQIPPDLPDGVIHVDYAPFGQLLPRCAAVVHHAGIGSTAQGLAAGIPQLLMPMAHDQPDNADRVRRLGAGRSISPRRYRPDRVAAILRDLLDDPAPRARAAACAARIDPAAARAAACAAIESLPPRSIPA